jgi:hypothetical protein
LPYSGIFGSMLVPSSPKRIAGLCALHRL